MKPAADPIAAVAAAAHAVLLDQLPDQEVLLNDRLAETLEPVKGNMRKTFGLELGKTAAEAILALREGDGAYQDPIGSVDFSTEPGVYQAVPPLEFVFAEFWKDLPPFALNNPDQFRIPPFPALASQHYADDFEEVKMIGELNSTDRTVDQSFSAKFWYEFSELGWNKIARVVAEDKNLDLVTTARLFALLNIATADSYIAGFDSNIITTSGDPTPLFVQRIKEILRQWATPIGNQLKLLLPYRIIHPLMLHWVMPQRLYLHMCLETILNLHSFLPLPFRWISREVLTASARLRMKMHNSRIWGESSFSFCL
ncbi:hypothetical protein [Rhodohalobacter sp.]|uniref:hypothetical protein n=1 Tax=Rhodohalobacter sp. TaxID=1974210 RepID=UPI002ACE8C66|nr:hypothetical protein [Rhodohalobacter sp.]MDZ7757532.1 hypothetical protein [Rhodohalobacter sp.]